MHILTKTNIDEESKIRACQMKCLRRTLNETRNQNKERTMSVITFGHWIKQMIRTHNEKGHNGMKIGKKNFLKKKNVIPVKMIGISMLIKTTSLMSHIRQKILSWIKMGFFGCCFFTIIDVVREQLKNVKHLVCFGIKGIQEKLKRGLTGLCPISYCW